MRAIAGLFLAMGLAGCAATPAPPATPSAAAVSTPEVKTAAQGLAAQNLAAQDLAAQYLAALRAAAVPEPAAVFDGLVALVPENPETVWQDGRVRVATLMREDTFQRFYSQDPPTREGPDAFGIIWVTPVPQLREFCAGIPGGEAAKVARLERWLGLKPESGYTRVVELSIDPANLARPCPDPEVTDTACTLDENAEPSADTAYNAWFTGNYRSSYYAGGFPWTRLGYTYDWAAPDDRLNPRRPVGASEYILRPNAGFVIAGRYTVAEYCANPTS